MGFAEAVEAAGAYLFLAFNHEFYVAGQLSGLNHEFEGLGLHEALSLVVVGTAGPDFAVFDDRLERSGAPFGEGFHGHDVHVAVDQHGGFLRVDDFFAIGDGIAHGGHHFGFVAAGLQQIFSPFFGTAHHVCLVLTFGTDGWNADEVEQFF